MTDTLNLWLVTETGRLMIAALGGFALATIAAFLKAYFSDRGKYLAVMHNIRQLQIQLRENTKITKQVEQDYSHQYVLWRSKLDYRERPIIRTLWPGVRNSYDRERHPYAMDERKNARSQPCY